MDTMEKQNPQSDQDMDEAGDSIENAEDFEIDDAQQKQEQAALKIVLPGDYIGEGFIAGHGTYECKDKNLQ